MKYSGILLGLLVTFATPCLAETSDTLKTQQEIIRIRALRDRAADVKASLQDYLTARDQYLQNSQGLIQSREDFAKALGQWIAGWEVTIGATQWADTGNFGLLQNSIQGLLDSQEVLFRRLGDRSTAILQNADEGSRILKASPKISAQDIPDQQNLVTEILKARQTLDETFSSNRTFYTELTHQLEKIQPFLHAAIRSRIRLNLVRSGSSMANQANEIADAFYTVELESRPLLEQLKASVAPILGNAAEDPEGRGPGYFEILDSRPQISQNCNQAIARARLGNTALLREIGVPDQFKSQVSELCRASATYFKVYSNLRIPPYRRLFDWATLRFESVKPRCEKADPTLNCELVRNLYRFIAFKDASHSPLAKMSETELRAFEQGWNWIYTVDGRAKVGAKP
ncbi:MAG: hypothetical protein H7222_09720 [Methylotenera sp.]|nr:hypothetical protein [Oligoflexia bacterium]